MHKGVALTTHEDVSRVIQSKNQVRGHYIGAQIVPDKCMVYYSLLDNYYINKLIEEY
jgi:hypothetical protein